MRSYRVTKYNPKHRDQFGRYLREEWTSISDIGKIFNEQLFTMEEYIKVEHDYIEFVEKLMISYDINHFKIKSLSKRTIPVFNSEKEYNFFENIYEESEISLDKIEILMKLILREKIWLKLVTQHIEVHFGYDYYMYVICKKNLSIEEIETNLFIENKKSPDTE